MRSQSFLLFPLIKSFVFAEENESGIVSFPILHYGHVLRRRHLERRHEDESRNDELEETYSGALYQGIGTHYVDIWVGHPQPQRQTLIIDTGSSIVGFPCDPCPKCGGEQYHTDPSYMDESSTTFTMVHCGDCEIGSCKHASRDEFKGKDIKYCGISASYAEGSSWSAYEAKDICYFGGPHDKPLERRHYNLRHRNLLSKIAVAKNTEELESEFKAKAEELEAEYEHESALYSAKESTFELRFGCQYKVTGLFKTQLADGICGMEDDEASFWHQMYDAGKIKRKAFSLCFSKAAVDPKGSHAGTMTLGGADERLHDSKMVYAEKQGAHGWYSVYISAVYLKYGDGDSNETNTVKIDVDLEDLNDDGIILDSGTTKSYLPTVLLNPFEKAFSELMDFQFQTVISEKDGIDPYTEYPTILLQLKGAINVEEDDVMDKNGRPLANLANSLDLDSPNDVILEIPPTHYMSHISKSKSYTNGFNMNDDDMAGVLGANSFFGYDILFDLDRKRIGFAKSNCDFDRLNENE